MNSTQSNCIFKTCLSFEKLLHFGAVRAVAGSTYFTAIYEGISEKTRSYMIIKLIIWVICPYQLYCPSIRITWDIHDFVGNLYQILGNLSDLSNQKCKCLVSLRNCHVSNIWWIYCLIIHWNISNNIKSIIYLSIKIFEIVWIKMSGHFYDSTLFTFTSRQPIQMVPPPITWPDNIEVKHEHIFNNEAISQMANNWS